MYYLISIKTFSQDRELHLCADGVFRNFDQLITALEQGIRLKQYKTQGAATRKCNQLLKEDDIHTTKWIKQLDTIVSA